MMEWKMVLLFLLAGVSAYLISGLNPAIILSKLIYHDDIRLKGSKNPGFTNFKRVYGSHCAWYVFVLDILKSVLPCIIFAWLFEHFYGHWQLGAAYTGLFSMIGHIFPVWYGFKGGKGFLVEVGAVYVIDWRAGLIATAVFLILLFTLKYMSLSSICFALVSPIAYAILGPDHWLALVFLVICSILLIARHHANIGRLMKGTESKFHFGGGKKKETDGK